MDKKKHKEYLNKLKGIVLMLEFQIQQLNAQEKYDQIDELIVKRQRHLDLYLLELESYKRQYPTNGH